MRRLLGVAAMLVAFAVLAADSPVKVKGQAKVQVEVKPATKDVVKKAEPKKEEKKPDPKDADKAGPKDNTPPDGFDLFFNGKNVTGWKGLIELPQRAKLNAADLEKKQDEANQKFLPHWTIKDGLLHYDGKGNNLQSVYDYGDFELWVDWRIGKKGTSGIYLRGNPVVQIWDNPEGSGGLSNNKKNPSKPLKVADNPVGQWNTFRILMKGDKATVYLNGVLVTDNTPLENGWEPGKPLPAKGPIELQHRGEELWFKNIYIRELSK